LYLGYLRFRSVCSKHIHQKLQSKYRGLFSLHNRVFEMLRFGCYEKLSRFLVKFYPITSKLKRLKLNIFWDDEKLICSYVL
jgi:hypothetical protein